MTVGEAMLFAGFGALLFFVTAFVLLVIWQIRWAIGGAVNE